MLSKKGLPTETSKYLDVHYIDDNDELIARPVEQKNTFFKLRNKKNNSESTDSNSSEREQ